MREELEHRYSADYGIAPSRRRRPRRAQGGGGEEPVALVLAASVRRELLTMTGRAPRREARARDRLGRLGRGRDRRARPRGVALSWADYYVLRPWHSPDELFHRSVTEFLHEWRRAGPRPERELCVVADPAVAARTRCGRCWRGTASRTGFYASDSEDGRELARASTASGAHSPGRRPPRRAMLDDPDNVELVARLRGRDRDRAEVRSTWSSSERAGRARGVGLRLVRGTRCLVVEREAIGGQAGSSRGSATTSASRAAWAAPSSRSGRTSSRGSSGRPSC